MKQRRITLADGRYLIFFTFDDQADDESAPFSAKVRSEAQGQSARESGQQQPVAKLEAEEERRV